MRIQTRTQLYKARKIFYTATLSAIIYICPQLSYADQITSPVHGVFIDTFSWGNLKPRSYFTDIYTNNQSSNTDCNLIKKQIPFTGTLQEFYLNTRQLGTVTSATNTRVSIVLNGSSTSTLLSSIDILNKTDSFSTSTLNIPVLKTDTYCLMMEPLNSSYPGGIAVNTEFIGQLLINRMSTTTAIIAAGSFDGVYYFFGLLLFLLVGGFLAFYFKRKR